MWTESLLVGFQRSYKDDRVPASMAATALRIN